MRQKWSLQKTVWNPNPWRNYLDTSRTAFTHCIWHCSTRWIDHGDEAKEAELLRGEVHVIAVEGVSSRKLRRRERGVAEACRRRRLSERIGQSWLIFVLYLTGFKSLFVLSPSFILLYQHVHTTHAHTLVEVSAGSVASRAEVHAFGQKHEIKND